MHSATKLSDANGTLVPVITSFGLHWHSGKLHTMYQRKVDVDMLNAVKSVLADISSMSPLSEQSFDSVDTLYVLPDAKFSILYYTSLVRG